MFQQIFLLLIVTSMSYGEVDNIYFSKCQSFFYKNTRPSGLDNIPWADLASICQTYGNTRHFATLYSKYYRIPIYSAYRLDSFDCPANQPSRRSTWFVEPQLYRLGHPKNMDLAGGNTALYQDSQAINKDYPNTDYDKGHLNPNFYQCNDGRVATFTLTNSVPQDPCFNQQSWKKMEETAKTIMSTACNFVGAKRYFVTGAVPSNNRIPNGWNDKEGDTQREYRRVSIPSGMWTAACCDSTTATNANDRNKGFSFAYYGDNVPDSLVIPATVGALEAKLVGLYRVQVVDIFADGCFKDSKTSEEALAYLAVPMEQKLGNMMNNIGKSHESSMPPATRGYLETISSSFQSSGSFARHDWKVNSVQFGILAKRSKHQDIRKTLTKRKVCTVLKMPAKALRKAINKPPRDELRSLKIHARTIDEIHDILNDAVDDDDDTLPARNIDDIEDTFNDARSISFDDIDDVDDTLPGDNIDEIKKALNDDTSTSFQGDDDTLSSRKVDEILEVFKDVSSKSVDGDDDTARKIDEIRQALKDARSTSNNGDGDMARKIDEIRERLTDARSTSLDEDTNEAEDGDDTLSANSDDLVDKSMLSTRSTTQQNADNEDKYVVVLSSDPQITANGDRCRSNHACDYHGKKYKWCYTSWNKHWDYCCTGSCDFYKGTSYHYCKSGNTWAYCSQRSSMVTVSNKRCRLDHECATHGHSYYWCYTDTKQNWDYCCQPWHDCLKHGYSYNWCYTGYKKSSRWRKCYF